MVKNINIISKRCLLSAFKTVLLLLFILIFWASERAFAAEYELVDGWEDAATRTIPEGSSKVSFIVTNTEYGFYKFKCPYCYNGGSHICYCEVDIPPRTAVVVINDLTNGNVIKRTGGDVDLDPSHKYKIQTFMNFEYGYALCKGFGDDDPNHCKGCGAKMPKYANITTSLKVYKFKAARFTSHPVNTTVYEGNSAAFSAAASDAKSYQWQVNENGNFYDIADGNGSGGLYYYGTNTPNLNISGCSIGHNNKGYRCIATGYSGERAESQTGILFVKAKATPTPVVTRPVSPSPSPTATPTSKPSPTASPTSKPSPTATPTSKPSPTVTPTSKPSPTATPTSKPSPTVTPTSKPSPTVTPTSKPSPTVTPTSKPSPTVTPTSKPSPTVTPTSKPSPTVTPTSKPSPTATPTSRPIPTATPTSRPIPTATPTSRPIPTATPTSKPSPTATPTSKPIPTATPTSKPSPTATPTSKPIPTATPTSSPIPTSFPSWETGTDPTGIPAREVTPVPEDRPVIIITPTPKPSYSPTETVSSEAEKEKDEEDEDKEFKEYDPLFEGLIDDYEEDTEEADQGGSDQEELYEEEIVKDNEIAYSKPPVVIGNAAVLEEEASSGKMKIAGIVFIVFISVLLILLLLFILFFGVIFLYEKDDEEAEKKKYGLAGFALLRYKDSLWSVNITSEIYDMAPLTIIFGPVYLAMFEGENLKISIKDENRYKPLIKKIIVEQKTVLK